MQLQLISIAKGEYAAQSAVCSSQSAVHSPQSEMEIIVTV